MNGQGGNDRIDAGYGLDFASGGDGNDRIEAADFTPEVVDILEGDNGDDRISAADGVRDLIDCGEGDDTAYVDELDAVENCETVFEAQEVQP